MPIIVNAKATHPYFPTLGSPLAIEAERAKRQDIRPLDILILNLMADKQATERQLAKWLGNSPIQVQLTFAATDSYISDIWAGRESRNTPARYIKDFYQPWSALQGKKFDGLIVTGVNALKDRVELEDFWPEISQVFEWSKTNVFSSLFLCWGAKAALKYFYDIDSLKGSSKLFGLFDHRILSDKTGLLFGFPDVFPVPVSRWKSPNAEAVFKETALEVVAHSDEAGPNILVEPIAYDEGKSLAQRRVFVLNHPEYETETLENEYRRDSGKDPTAPLPKHYFPGDDPSQKPLNLWRHTAVLYTNWVKTIYEATPHDVAKIPEPFKSHGKVEGCCL